LPRQKVRNYFSLVPPDFFLAFFTFAASLVVVATALPFRASTVPFSAVGANWPIIINLLAGSLGGAWVGAGWATRLTSETLYRVIAVLLVLIAGILLFAHDTAAEFLPFTGTAQMVAGIIAGFVIGVIASLLGVAGGEFLISTMVLLFGADIRTRDHAMVERNAGVLANLATRK
jgi:uncharacterized protein